MIKPVGGVQIATCDGCGTQLNTGLKPLPQARIFISRVEGWHNRNQRGVWSNYCPRCGEAADDLDIIGIGVTKRPTLDD
jgi:hypothetical protein